MRGPSSEPCRDVLGTKVAAPACRDRWASRICTVLPSPRRVPRPSPRLGFGVTLALA